MSLAVARPCSTGDLSTSERSFVIILRQLGFGHIESIKIRRGALVLDPWPKVVQVLKFGATENQRPNRPAEFELKKPVAEFLEYIRGVDDGEIHCLEVRHGLPFSMEIERRISREMPDVKGEHVEAV